MFAELYQKKGFADEKKVFISKGKSLDSMVKKRSEEIAIENGKVGC